MIVSWATVIILAFGAACLAGAYLFTYFVLAEKAAEKSKIKDPEKRAAFKDSYTRTLAQIIAGVALVVTFLWTVVKDSQTLERNSITAANQQFVDAAKLIGDNRVETRTAGVYSMKRLVDAHPEFLDPVEDTLKTDARAETVDEEAAVKQTLGLRKPLVPPDVRAATVVLGRLDRNGRELQLVDFYLAGADFFAAIDLRKADFRGAKLWAANFTGSELTGAQFSGAGMADYEAFGYANGAWDARLTKARSSKEESDWWEHEKFRYIIDFGHADLVNADFQNSGITGAYFGFATLTGAHFEKSDISRADFTKAIDLDKAHFDGACYGGPNEMPRGLPEGALHQILKLCP